MPFRLVKHWPDFATSARLCFDAFGSTNDSRDSTRLNGLGALHSTERRSRELSGARTRVTRPWTESYITWVFPTIPDRACLTCCVCVPFLLLRDPDTQSSRSLHLARPFAGTSTSHILSRASIQLRLPFKMSNLPDVEKDHAGSDSVNGKYDLHHDHHTEETALRRIRTAGSISITPELFEKIYLSPKNRVSNNIRSTVGNPTPLYVSSDCISSRPLIEVVLLSGSCCPSLLFRTFYWDGEALAVLAPLKCKSIDPPCHSLRIDIFAGVFTTSSAVC